MSFEDSKTKAIQWRPTASVDALRFRATMLRRTREFFDQRGLFEVQTPCLLAETVVDAHLEPLRLSLPPNGRTLFLQTSPEAAMKRLLAAGAEAIYQLGPVFRADETGQYHNLEFTMLEWYRRGDGMEDGIGLLCDFVRAMIPDVSLTRTTYRHLFTEHLDIDPFEASLNKLRSVLAHHEPTWQFDPLEFDKEEDSRGETTLRDDLLDALMGLVLQPTLQGGVVVSNYPLSQAALARRSETDPMTAERFELFINGVEIANGYAELCDGDELAMRTERGNAQRMGRGAESLPPPTRLIAAMRNGFPACSGTALGFDRLVMVAGGFTDIGQVLAFPGCA